jgi:hypothetical protein
VSGGTNNVPHVERQKALLKPCALGSTGRDRRAGIGGRIETRKRYVGRRQRFLKALQVRRPSRSRAK